MPITEIAPYLPKQETVVEEPLSFDLSFEKKRVRKVTTEAELRRTYSGLMGNMEFWSREYIAHIPTTHYLWGIENQTDGSVRLNHPNFGYADEISWNAAYGPDIGNIPQYEKERRAVEHNVTSKMYKQLENSEVGQVFIWSSPPPEGVKNENYGGYTMTHVYEVDELSDGQKVLKGRDILHHASNKKQKEVLEYFGEEQLFDQEEPTSIDILGKLVRVKKDATAIEIEQKMKEEKEEESGNIQDQKLEKFNEILDKHRGTIVRIHQYLYQGNDYLALALFQQWVDNVERDWQEFQQSKIQQIVDKGDGVGVSHRALNPDFVDHENPHIRAIPQKDGWGIVVPGNRVDSSHSGLVMQQGGSCGRGFGMSGLASPTVSQGRSEGLPIVQAFSFTPQVVAGSLAGNQFIQRQEVVEDEETYLLKTYGKDDLGCRAFRCPEAGCKKINVRPFNRLIPECGHCGSDKVAC